ncbi:MAG TPA: hypothetical protein VF280_10185 [Burkholderiales bacterium]|jgi:hypothetical protein
MRARLAFIAAILLATPALAQFAKVTEGESHIASAFTSGADPKVLADDVRLGPVLRRELGGADGRKVYEALFARVSGRTLKVDVLAPADAARYARLVGSAAEPLILLEAGEVALLLQYAQSAQHVTFVEQLPVRR